VYHRQDVADKTPSAALSARQQHKPYHATACGCLPARHPPTLLAVSSSNADIITSPSFSSSQTLARRLPRTARDGSRQRLSDTTPHIYCLPPFYHHRLLLTTYLPRRKRTPKGMAARGGRPALRGAGENANNRAPAGAARHTDLPAARVAGWGGDNVALVGGRGHTTTTKLPNRATGLRLARCALNLRSPRGLRSLPACLMPTYLSPVRLP